MGRGLKRRHAPGRGFGLRSYVVPPASPVTVTDPEGNVHTEPAKPPVEFAKKRKRKRR